MATERWNHTATLGALMLRVWTNAKLSPIDLHPFRDRADEMAESSAEEKAKAFREFVTDYAKPPKKRKGK